MKVTAIKTPIVKANDDLYPIIENSIKNSQLGTLPEKSVVIVTSKIISYTQGRLVAKKNLKTETSHKDKTQKQALVKQEAEYYLPASYSQPNMMMAIKHGTLTVNAGIDESNAMLDDKLCYVLWPENLQETANQIWQFLHDTFGLKQVGVIITDSRTWPMRWGVVGTCLAHCGFKQLKDWRGTKDLFGREIKMVQVNVAEAIAAAAALEMGEVAEQTPLGVVEDIKQIVWQAQVPTQQELKDLLIDKKDDVYGSLIDAVEWVKN